MTMGLRPCAFSGGMESWVLGGVEGLGVKLVIIIGFGRGQALAEALHANVVLEVLDLRGNAVGAAGAAALEAARAAAAAARPQRPCQILLPAP
jgi:hypothetical protein